MEGFLNLRLKPWMRRLLTRGLAVIPVLGVLFVYGEQGTGRLLLFSQVVLSMQLPFAVIPLVSFVSNKRLMGELQISKAVTWLAWTVALIIVVLNGMLLREVLRGA